MKKTRILSLLLCLSLFSTLIVPGTRAYAESDPDNGMKISKTATANKDGFLYHHTGSLCNRLQDYNCQEKDIPYGYHSCTRPVRLWKMISVRCDIQRIRGITRKTKNNYERRHNGGSANLWHKLPDGLYCSVSVTLQQTITYNKITKGRNDNGSNGYTNYWENRNNLYTYVNGEIKKLSIPVSAIMVYKIGTANMRLRTVLS